MTSGLSLYSANDVTVHVLVIGVWKFLGDYDPAFAVAEHQPLLVYLRVQSFRSKLHALQICLCMIGRKKRGSCGV